MTDAQIDTVLIVLAGLFLLRLFWSVVVSAWRMERKAKKKRIL